MNGPRRRTAARWLATAGLLLGSVAVFASELDVLASELDQRIVERLRALDPELASRVTVSARDGAVLLTGVVRIYEHVLQAERVAWTTEGVLDVENELRVIPLLPVEDAAIERRVREILKTDPRFADVSVRVDVKAGFVKLAGLFEDPGEVLSLKHRVASVEGVLHVEIEAMLVAGGQRPANS